MAQKTTYQAALELQTREQDLCDAHATTFDSASPIALDQLAQQVFSLSGSDSQTITAWGNSPPLMKVPHILLLQTSAIVDVFDYDETTFTQHHGLTPKQFSILAHDGFIIPNLYKDSDLSRREADSLYARHPHLAEIFSAPTARINGMRRRHLFKIQGIDLQKAAYEFREQLEAATGDLSLSQLGNLLATPIEERSGALNILDMNMAYIDTLGTTNDRNTIRRFRDNHLPWTPSQLVTWIKGRKTAVAAPITSCFGGSTNFTSTEANTIQAASIISDEKQSSTSETVTVRDDDSIAFAQFMQGLSELAASGSFNFTVASTTLPMSDTQFSNFREFLIATRELRRRADGLLRQFAIYARETEFEGRLTDCLSYYRIYEEIATEANKSESVGDILKIGAGVYAGLEGGRKLGELALEHYLKINVNRRVVLFGGAVAGATLGGFGVHVGSKLAEKLIAPAPNQALEYAQRVILRDVDQFLDTSLWRKIS